MGFFYTSIILNGPAQESVTQYLVTGGYAAFVSPTVEGRTVVLEKESEDQGPPLFDLASGLSAHFRCPALAALLHDGDFLYYQLFEDGMRTDAYNSEPSYFIDEEPRPPEGGDARRLCKAFGVPQAIDEVNDILRDVSDDAAEHWVDAEDRHDRLVRTLGLPSFASGVGFYAFEAGTNKERYNSVAFTKVGL